MDDATPADANQPVLLQTYVDVLSDAARGRIKSIEHWPENSVARRAARELLRSGLLSDARMESEAGLRLAVWVESIVLTPEGALALIQWRDFIRESRLSIRVARGLYHWLLVLVGAVAGGVAGVVATRLWPPQ